MLFFFCLMKTNEKLKKKKESLVNPFPNKPWFLRVCSTSPLKTLREKEKLLVTSNLSFSHSVFYPFGYLSSRFRQILDCRLQTLSVWKSLKLSFGTGLNPLPKNPWFINPEEEDFWKHYKVKNRMLVTNNFSFSHNLFFHIKDK